MTRDELTRATAEANMAYVGDSWPADKHNKRAEAVSAPGWREICAERARGEADRRDAAREQLLEHSLRCAQRAAEAHGDEYSASYLEGSLETLAEFDRLNNVARPDPRDAVRYRFLRDGASTAIFREAPSGPELDAAIDQAIARGAE